MHLIVGLGNPGKKYEKTRHNAGFLTINQLQITNNNFSDWKFEKKFKAEVSKGEIDGEKVILVKPQTFMNNSGEAVVKLLNFFRRQASEKTDAWRLSSSWVIHDDLDLPLGKIRISFEASSAGHKGVQSIIDALKTKEFWRLRIGIAPSPPPSPARGEGEKAKAEKFVLRPFKKEEQKILKQTLDKAVNALLLALKDPQKAMSEYNK